MASENNAPYIFVSYAHANSDRVLPTIQKMKDANISLWYDEGIVAGSEWPEFIAEKVVGCHKFILFISEAYLNSQNCKRELNFAISRKKNILAVFLEEVHLSPGMEMQLGTYQAIFRNRFSSDADFWASICKEPFFDSCRIKQPASTPPVTATQNPEPTVRYTPRQGNGQPYQQPNPTGYTPQQPVRRPGYTPPTGYHQPVQPQRPPQTQGYTAPNRVWQGGAQPTSSYNPAYFNAATSTNKNKFLAAALSFFLGWCGAQHFYMGKTLFGVLSIVFFFFSLVIGVPALAGILVYIGIGEAIWLLCIKNDKFQAICANNQNNKKKPR